MIEVKEIESNLARKVRQHYKEHGLVKTLISVTVKALQKIISIVYNAIDYKIAVISLDKIMLTEAENNNRYHCKISQAEDMEAVEKRFGRAISEEFARRMDSSMGYLIFDIDEVVGYAWGSKNLVKNQGMMPFLFDIRPMKGSIYIYDTFIVPEKRRRGAYKRLKHYYLSEVKKEGFKTLFLLFDRRNLAVESVTFNLGFRIEGQISYRRYFWRVRTNTSALKKVCEAV